MRWFAAHREASDRSSATIPGRRPVRAVIFALACLAGLGFSAGERFEARADDGGMMSFLLRGNGSGRARVAVPQFRFDPPAFRQRSPVVRRAARAHHKSRAAHHAIAWRRAKHSRHAAVPARMKDIPKPMTQVALGPVDMKVTAHTLALKAAAAAARPDDPHFRDKTLRRGDIVATTTGLRVFLGAAHFPYRPRDFAPVSTARHVAQRRTLEALDRSLRGVRVVARAAKMHIAKVANRLSARAEAPRSVKISVVRRVDVPPASQTVALAYAPRVDTIVAATPAPAVDAIERIVRRVDAQAPRPTNAEQASRASPPRRRHVRQTE
ncbi:MAG: hypothetical protein H6872_04765 [Methylobacteriaceae bacterium]|nr:hypothetical protein [Methylobacteriaceae bacterium]